MLRIFAIRFLQLLRSSDARHTLAEIFQRLSSASVIAAAWLFYAGGLRARAIVPALLIASVVFLFAALAALKED